ncbi:MAG: alpha/beta fold hydrolase, partial [Acidobacteria bacterium]|nr:alpha/beta fold hydrolase [Acidobacteriota bacterium]
ASQTPVPYRSEPLSVTNGAVTLSGTLTMPPGPGPFPAVVLITGSGGQNRDKDIFGFKVFGVLADHLTRHGIAVYRYDDRGVGESTGRIATSTTADFADDALAGIARLAAMPDIDPARIGLIGHSEGARAMGAGDEAVAKIEAAHRAMVGDIPAWVEKTYRPHLAQIWLPWMKYFVAFDPADALRKVSVPAYAAFGGLDIQVLPELNEGPMRLFQRAKTGLVTEYATLEKVFVPGLLEDIATWIQTATRR